MHWKGTLSGARGHGEWESVPRIVDALDAAFYAAFGAVQPTGKRLLLALDVSWSMTQQVSGLPISCREASAALALVTSATEKSAPTIVGFTSKSGSFWNDDTALRTLPISPRRRLDDAVHAVSDLPFGATDCALPMVLGDGGEAAGRHVHRLHRQRHVGRSGASAPGAAALPGADGHRRAACLGGVDADSVLDRRARGSRGCWTLSDSMLRCRRYSPTSPAGRSETGRSTPTVMQMCCVTVGTASHLPGAVERETQRVTRLLLVPPPLIHSRPTAQARTSGIQAGDHNRRDGQRVAGASTEPCSTSHCVALHLGR